MCLERCIAEDRSTGSQTAGSGPEADCRVADTGLPKRKLVPAVRNADYGPLLAS